MEEEGVDGRLLLFDWQSSGSKATLSIDDSLEGLFNW